VLENLFVTFEMLIKEEERERGKFACSSIRTLSTYILLSRIVTRESADCSGKQLERNTSNTCTGPRARRAGTTAVAGVNDGRRNENWIIKFSARGIPFTVLN